MCHDNRLNFFRTIHSISISISNYFYVFYLTKPSVEGISRKGGGAWLDRKAKATRKKGGDKKAILAKRLCLFYCLVNSIGNSSSSSSRT